MESTLSSGSQDSQFTVASRLEITQILHALMREAAQIAATVSDNTFFLTSILAIDEQSDSLLLEGGRNSRHIVNALGTGKLLCSATLDKIRIQFTCEYVESLDYDGSEAYKTLLPTKLLRLQRREHYRITTPIVSPVKCRIFPDNEGKDKGTEFNLHDISCGGISVVSPPGIFAPELGKSYLCNLQLPDTSGLRITVQTRNTFMVTLPNGKISQRTGFAFVNPAESIVATIQRYILNLERQRRTRGERDS